MTIFRFLKSHVGPVPNPISGQTRQAHARIKGASASVSVCPYCAVGCSQVVYTKGGRVLDIEGNYESPINGGTLCPKGAATSGLMASPARVTTVKYRAPYGTRWEERPLDWAMERIAQRVKQTRDATFQETVRLQFPDGEVERRVNHTRAIASLGGATMDIEWNYVQAKLMRALGVVNIENQARI